MKNIDDKEYIADGHSFGLLKDTPKFPFHIDLELNTSCNLNCKMCDRTGFEEGELSLVGAKKIIKYCADNGTKSIKPFWRGESTIYKDIIEVLKYAQQCGLKTMINTNGLFDSEMSIRLSRYLDWVSFSIDEGHGNHKSKTVLTNLELFSNPDFFKGHCQVESGTSNRKLISKLHEINKNIYVDMFTKRTDEADYDFFDLEGYPRKYCGFPEFRMIITWKGEMKPCCVCWKDGELSMGYIDGNLDNIKNAWNTRFYKLRKELKQNIFTEDICKNCQSKKAYDVS